MSMPVVMAVGKTAVSHLPGAVSFSLAETNSINVNGVVL
jgi:hypothetical protein